MNYKLRCIVVDDDAVSLKILEGFINKTEFLHSVGFFESALEASEALEGLEVDLILLDIEMPGMTGLEFIGILEKRPQIIFISLNQQYALDAFQYDVTDYLLKPFSYERFLKATYKAWKNLIKNKSFSETSNLFHNIFIKIDSLLISLNLQDIYFIEAFGDYVRIKTPDNSYTVYSTLKTVEEKLPAKDFVRIHRSYIVRVDKIKHIGANQLEVLGKALPIGNIFKKDLMDRITTL